MRIGTGSGILHLIVSWPWMRSFGDVSDDTCSTPRYRVDGKATVQQRHPFTHSVETEPVTVGLRAARLEAVAVVLDNEGGCRVGLGDADDGRGRARVFADVRQGLLDDPDHLDLATRRQGHFVVEVTVQCRCDLTLLAVLDQVR